MKFSILKLSYICLILCFSFNIFGQSSVNNTFKGGEKLRFVGSYYLSSLWSDLAEIRMEVSDQVVNV